jgi:hypothetical protein
MKLLRQSLIDYEPAMLQAIAACRAVALEMGGPVAGVDQLAEVLLSPVNIAIILGDLSQAEKEGLQFLIEHEGQVEGARFARQYGSIRLMGSARLERERPWQNPANPAESLWYRALIFKTFQVTDQGSQEIIYIPDDLLILLQTHFPQTQTTKTFQVSQVAAPASIVSGAGRLRENFFRILVYLQTTPVRLQNNVDLLSKDKQNLLDCLLPPLATSLTGESELDFLLHIGRRAGLLIVAHGRLRPERETIRNWLQTPEPEQIQILQNTWRADPTWNDLWRVPSLSPQLTGWENSPLLARSKILGYLEQLAGSEAEWLSIDRFVAAVKRVDPDFQRPNGDYDSWYIQDKLGSFLMGFEHWEEVEGALIRYLLTQVLLLLGVVELGCLAETPATISFRLTPPGKAFLKGQIYQVESLKKPIFFRADSNFYVYVPTQASLYDRFQLARFAQLERYERNRTSYQISLASISRALRNGVTPDQITAFLSRVTNTQIPLKVVETIRTWGTRHATVQLEPATLLRLKHEDLAAELRRQPVLGRLLGEALNSTTLLVPTQHVDEVRRLLTELGYLE